VRDIVGDLDTNTWEVRRWEAFLFLDRPRNLLLLSDIDFFKPLRREVAGVAYFLSDTVLNWNICRREIIERGGIWDPRFICNGEHEDFYLNLKENTDVKAAYCPSLVVYHHSAADLAYARKRNAAEGWQLFADKWGILEDLEPLTGASLGLCSGPNCHTPGIDPGPAVAAQPCRLPLRYRASRRRPPAFLAGDPRNVRFAGFDRCDGHGDRSSIRGRCVRSTV